MNHPNGEACGSLCFLAVNASALVHAWGKGNMAVVSKRIALTHLALLDWLP